MARPPRVVELADIRVTKTWGGDLRFSYSCPKCGDPLHSTNDEVMRQDACPSCGRAFVFGAVVQHTWLSHRAEQQAAVEQKALEQQRKQAERAQQKLAREVAAREEREKAAEQVARSRQKVREAEESAKRSKQKRGQLDGTEDFIASIVGIGGVLCALAIVGGCGALLNKNVVAGVVIIAPAVSLLLGLLIFRAFFTCLFTINQNLEKINRTLLEGRSDRGPPY